MIFSLSDFVPSQLRDDLDRKFNFILLVLSVLFVGIPTIPFTIDLLLTNNNNLPHIEVALVLFSTACFPLLIVILYKTLRVELASHILLFAIILRSVTVAFFGGGFRLIRISPMVLVPPLSSFLFTGYVSGLYFSLTVIIWATLYSFDAHLPQANLSPEYLAVKTFKVDVVQMTIVYLICWLFGHVRMIKHRKLELERDRAEELANVKSEFTRNVSHELRTPLNSIIGFAEMLFQDPRLQQIPDVRESLGTILKSSEHLSHLLDAVLDFSKLEAGATLEEAPFDIEDFVHSTLRSFSPQFDTQSKRLVLDMQYPRAAGSSCLSVLGDSHRLGQVLLNLVSNSLKFTSGDTGEVIVRVTVGNPSSSDDPEQQQSTVDVGIEVIDNGIGIGAKALKKLLMLTPFTQEDASTTRKYGGTGLGLVITQQICSLLGCKLIINSRPGEGTAIRMNFKLKRDRSEARQPAPSIERSNLVMVPDRCRIAIVSESVALRNVLRSDLTESIKGGSYSITEFSSISEVSRLPVKSFDLIICKFKKALNNPASQASSIAERFLFLTKIKHNSKTLICSDNVSFVLANPIIRSSLHQSLASLYSQPPASSIFGILRTSRSFSQIYQALPRDDPNAIARCNSDPSSRKIVSKQFDLKPLKESIPHKNIIKTNDSTSLPRVASPSFRRVLLAEDNEMNQRIFSKQFHHLGVQVDMASNGLEALRAVENNRNYLAIFLDLHMPLCDGFECAARIRELERCNPGFFVAYARCAEGADNAFGSIPIVALTASTLSDDKKAAFESGMSKFLCKPTRITELKACLVELGIIK